MTLKKATTQGKGSDAQVRRYLATYIPQEMSDLCVINDGKIFYNKKPFAAYKRFEDFHEPLFAFVDMTLFQQTIIYRRGHKPQPAFRLTLGPFGTPRLYIDPKTWTKELDDLLVQMVANKASFTTERPEALIRVVDFWCAMKTAKEFLDEVNTRYNVTEAIPRDEVRGYRASWLHNEIRFIGPNGDTYFAKTLKRRMDVTQGGIVEVHESRVMYFNFSDGGSHFFENGTVEPAVRIGKGN